MAHDEVHIAPDAPRPKGYGFLKKGNPFMTALCRRKTHAAGQRLYIVSSRKAPIGLLAPRKILDEVFAEERQTRHQRSAAVEKRDGHVHNKFKQAILRLFPKIPTQDIPSILDRTLKKRSGRVGRTSKLPLDDKVRLAVVAHVRHCHTGYDQLLRQGTDKSKARKTIASDITRIMGSWGGDTPARTAQKKLDRRSTSSPKKKKVASPKRKLARLPAKPVETRPKPTKSTQNDTQTTKALTRSHATGKVLEVIEISDSEGWSGEDTEDSDSWEDSADEYCDDDDDAAASEADVVVISDSDLD